MIKQILFFLSFILLMVEPAGANICKDWLSESAFGRVSILDSSQEPSVEVLLKSFQDFRLSRHGRDSYNFEQLIKQAEKLKIILEKRLEEKNTTLKSEMGVYSQQFSFTQKLWPWSFAADFRKANIKPLKKTIKNLEITIETLKDISRQAESDQLQIKNNKFAYEAKLIFTAAQEEFGDRIAFVAAQALLNSRHELKPQLTLLKNLIETFKNKYSEKIAVSLSMTLIETGRTDVESVTKVQKIYDELLLQHSPAMALGLTTLVTKHNFSEEVLRKVATLHKLLSTIPVLKDTVILPFMAYYLKNSWQMINQRDLAFLSTDLNRMAYQSRKITSEAAAIMMSSALSVSRMWSVEKSSEKLIAYYHAYLKTPKINPIAAAILASASLLSSPQKDISTYEVLNLWTSFHKLPKVNAVQAAGMVFKVLVLQNFDGIQATAGIHSYSTTDYSSTSSLDTFTLWYWTSILSSSSPASSSQSSWSDSFNSDDSGGGDWGDSGGGGGDGGGE